ncbi:MAG TPA: tetratricopeptide repeat protein, partial [Candidatus Eisenbacteria bacterium]|nr:tetratricopeptide repeat protein [Candidatus Eisenbacteria bacterium]
SIELDPLVSAGYTGLAQVYRAMDRLPDSEQAMRKAMELSPQRLGASMMLTILLSDQGKHAEAVREAGREGAEWARLTALAYAYQKAGQTVECDKALRQLEEGHAVDSPYQIAAVHNAKGDVDAAFAWLNRAVEERDAGVAQVAVEPVFRNLHSDPRWKPLLKRINIV